MVDEDIDTIGKHGDEGSLCLGTKHGKLPRYIVVDIVFKGTSLNYDESIGNYMPLKKITLYDGRSYTLVSRYALRYSLWRTLVEILGREDYNRNDAFTQGEEVIQLDESILLCGRLFEYPEFDLFGYLVTSLNPQQSKEAAVKINHAVSMTPYMGSSHFSNNVGLAQRLLSTQGGELKPNIFILEEHETYYITSIVIDVNKIGHYSLVLGKEFAKKPAEKLAEKIYSLLKEKDILGNFEAGDGEQSLAGQILGKAREKRPKYKDEVKKLLKMKIKKYIEAIFDEEDDPDKYIDEIKDLKEKGLIKDESIEQFNSIVDKLDCIRNISELEWIDLGDSHKYVEVRKDDNYRWKRIVDILCAICRWRRRIKGRDVDLSPRVMLVGVYYDGGYKSYVDRIRFSTREGSPFGIDLPLFKLLLSKDQVEVVDDCEDVIKKILEGNDGNVGNKLLLYVDPSVRVAFAGEGSVSRAQG